MKVLFYLGHPAHYHLFKNIISEIKAKGGECFVLIKTKDVLEKLLQHDQVPYINIHEAPRKNGKVGIALSIIEKVNAIRKITRKHKPDFLVGSTAELTIVGKLLRIPSLIFFEDDFEHVRPFAKIAGPLATHLICPTSCSAWKWEKKTIKYPGYHELAYLHPRYFQPDRAIAEKVLDLDQKNFILRLAELNAYHDTGVSGINTGFAQQIIDKLSAHGNVFITAERQLEPQFEQYRIAIDPRDIHHVMYFADMYIGDSQTMAAEAAVLGTPALRYNDFVGKLGYLEELEHKWELTYGIPTDQPQQLLDRIDALLAQPGKKETWEQRKTRMLGETIDLNAFTWWFLEQYPASIQTLKEQPQYSLNFIPS